MIVVVHLEKSVRYGPLLDRSFAGWQKVRSVAYEMRVSMCGATGWGGTGWVALLCGNGSNGMGSNGMGGNGMGGNGMGNNGLINRAPITLARWDIFWGTGQLWGTVHAHVAPVHT
jgi:hypothetical protein